jgi:hypothetical protein
MSVDPKKIRRQLNTFVIEFNRELSFAEAIEKKCLASNGEYILACAVQCFFVGFFDIGRELALKGQTFVRAAIEHKEVPRLYSRGLSECHRLRDFALASWLVQKLHDVRTLQEAAHWRTIWFDEHPDIARRDIQLALSEYLEAAEYETLVERFEQVGAKKPASLRRIQGEGAMCYVIARQRLGLEYTVEEIEAAVNTFLKRHVRQWLAGGHWTRAARWMKIAFWKKGDDPIATVLRFYDYLPGLKRPKYP